MGEGEKPRVVLDGGVYLQALMSSGGPAAACVKLLEAGEFSLFVSDYVLEETKDISSRSEIRSRVRSLTDERVQALLQFLSENAAHVTDVPHVFSYPRDPDDEPYINLAVAVGAAYLVSRDKDLLELMKDADFRARFPDLTILDPVEFLHEMTIAREKAREQT